MLIPQHYMYIQVDKIKMHSRVSVTLYMKSNKKKQDLRWCQRLFRLIIEEAFRIRPQDREVRRKEKNFVFRLDKLRP